MSDTELAKQLLEGDLESSLSDAKAEVGKQFTVHLKWVKAADDAMASTTTAEAFVASVPYAGLIKAIYFIPGAAITADASDFATLTVRKYDAAGANDEIVGTLTTELVAGGGIGNATAGVRYAFTLVSAQLPVVAGGSLTFEIAKAMSGVVVPASLFEVHMEKV